MPVEPAMTTEREVNAFVRQLRASLLAAVRAGGSVSYLCPEVLETICRPGRRTSTMRHAAYVISVHRPRTGVARR
jgi:hypothetical protein